MSDEVVEQTLTIIANVSVYKVPPKSTARGFKCGEWKVSDKIWDGRLRVMAIGKRCEIRLEDVNSGELFATCPFEAGRKDTAVEPALDSSRYFMLRVENEGKHAFIGLGFAGRSEAFDFNVSLTDFEKHVMREDQTGAPNSSSSQLSEEPLPSQMPTKDYSLKAGETIKVSLNRPLSARPGSRPPSAMGPRGVLAPPPGMALQPPPGTQSAETPSDPADDPFAALAAARESTQRAPPSELQTGVAAMSTATTAGFTTNPFDEPTGFAAVPKSTNPFDDLGSMEDALPGIAKAEQHGAPAGWTTFD